MASLVAQLNDIKDQESDIFQELAGHHDDDDDDDDNLEYDEPSFRKNYRIARLKAKQQLALSEDSPFAHLNDDGKRSASDDIERQQIREKRAELLRNETSQIRDQLNFVKQRLQEIKSGQHERSTKTNQSIEIKKQQQQQQPIVVAQKRVIDEKTTARQVPQAETRYRPLTGKADCPNCACDARKRSICDLCVKINTVSSLGVQRATKPKEVTKCYTDYTNDYDNRPIRPAKERTLARVEVSTSQVSNKVVNDVVVPGKVYTISRSLNDKRTKLAQAIDELQRMMEQVKAKSNKLEEERKLVQLYKDQWKYGPSIGGPKGSSRERLGLNNAENRNYESRLDANLARDSKSIMGFKHIEPGMKLRQYNKQPPVAAPRRTLATKKKPTQSSTISKSSALASSGTSTIRSKSLESLRQVHRPRVPPHVVINENFQNGKASSEINLRKINENKEKEEDEDEDGDEIKEKLEEEMRVAEDDNENENETETEIGIIHSEDAPPSKQDNETRQQRNDTPIDDTGENRSTLDRAEMTESNDDNDGKISRVTWIPVFGETEIKTVKKPATRKVLQVMGSSNNQQNRGNNIVTSTTTTKTRSQEDKVPLNRYQSQKTSTIVGNNLKRVTIVSPSSNSNSNSSSNQPKNQDRVMNEANRKLRFATDLLEQERCDSRNKNQLLVNKRQLPIPINIDDIQDASAAATANNVTATKSTQDSQTKSEQTTTTTSSLATKSPGVEFSESSRNELARIEEMVNEQQKLLNRLAQLQERQQIVSPVTVTCSSPSCCTVHRYPGEPPPPMCSNSSSVSRVPKVRRSLLVNTLRDRLNKGKLQLARTLEQEREKHQQLKLRVNSSLRKQSDLQHENELLKQSLGKCIDTCLRDITNTFESLSDTLADSVVGIVDNNNNLGHTNLDQATTNYSQRNVVSSNEDLTSESSQNVALSNAAQFITDNKYLKQLTAHIEVIEQQRKSIFEELKKEKLRSLQLETKLKESQSEMNHLDGIRQKLEIQLKSIEVNKNIPGNVNEQPTPGCSKDSQPHDEHILKNSATETVNPHLSAISREVARQQTDEKNTSQMEITETLDQQSSLELDDSQSSVELYRKYIESMSPDIESIRRERKMILSEFDNLKKMLSVMDQ